MKAKSAILTVAITLALGAPILWAQNFSADDLAKRTLERRAVEAVGLAATPSPARKSAPAMFR